MLNDDDTNPKTKKPVLKSLDALSVAELRDYLHFLAAEGQRVEAEIARKEKHLQAADALFKKPAE